MEFRNATFDDARQLARMNQLLIRDEGHRNPMSPAELEDRMTAWLAHGEYQAVLFEMNSTPVGYCLFRDEDAQVYVRQYFVVAESRRLGVATAAWNWLTENLWQNADRIRLDVLVGNAAGIAFWRSLGFADYCVTMELDCRGDS